MTVNDELSSDFALEEIHAYVGETALAIQRLLLSDHAQVSALSFKQL